MSSSSKQIKVLGLFAIASLASMMSCSHANRGETRSALRDNGGIDGGGIANPASEYCEKKGGNSEIYKGPQGEVGFCKLGGALIEEWTLYRFKVDTPRSPSSAITAFMKAGDQEMEVGPGGANPASVYCEKIGGKSVMYESTQGQTGACDFEDQSSIEEWTLFRGVNDPNNAKLKALLSK